jgi:hypothetical protein
MNIQSNKQTKEKQKEGKTRYMYTLRCNYIVYPYTFLSLSSVLLTTAGCQCIAPHANTQHGGGGGSSRENNKTVINTI